MDHRTPMAPWEDDAPEPRVPLWRRALFVLASMVVGALLVIAIGQLFALTRSTCDTICRPEYAGVYGAIGGIIFSLMFKPAARRDPPQPAQ